MSDSTGLGKVAVVTTGSEGVAVFREMDFPLGVRLDASAAEARVRDAGSESKWHGAPAGQAVLVLVLQGWLTVYVECEQPGHGKDFGPGDWILFQDDGDASVPPGRNAGHKSVVRAESPVRQVAVFLPKRFELPE